MWLTRWYVLHSSFTINLFTSEDLKLFALNAALKKKKKDVRQPVFWWCLVDAYIENKVLRESVKSITHIFMARVSLTKNLQFWEMLQPTNGWQSSLTEKGKLLSNQHAAKFCWRLFLKWRFYFNSYLGLYNGSVSTVGNWKRSICLREI